MRKNEKATFESLKAEIRQDIAEIRKDPKRWTRYLEGSNLAKAELDWVVQVSKLLAKGGDEYLDSKIATPEERKTYRYYKHKVKEKARRAMNDLLKIVAVSEAYDDAAWDEMFYVGNLAILLAAFVERQGLEAAQPLAAAIEIGMREWALRNMDAKLAEAFDLQVPVMMRTKPDVMTKLVVEALREAVKDSEAVPES